MICIIYYNEGSKLKFTEAKHEDMTEKPVVELPGTVVRLSSSSPVFRKQLKVREHLHNQARFFGR